MAEFPNPAIQSDYSRYQSKGLPGQRASSDNGVYFFDTASTATSIGVLRPSQGVFLNSSGEWITAIDGQAADILLITHILSFENTTLNTPLSAPVGNADSEVVYPEGTPGVKAFSKGSVFVTAGATILRGQAVEYKAPAVAGDDAGTYIVSTQALGASRLSIIALENAAADDIFAVRINQIN
ncbi:MAG: hypothetical protein V3V61_03920 [Gammaproteobacteria bacterium]